ncbi:OmpA family protein [Halomonas sp. TD01]|uniref:OmpA family protein n=1 Tax=Halomonas sp. TD01 TaxID=999141 RepID=UPI000214F2DD|nr:OmpA family protein [Halomonas sp. TD01]EGP18164.1 OmpA-family lipoprotein [Halomonas sp. TD01]CAH1043414.1 Outer membrane protein A precursor [Halomonas sp. TD01]
MKNRSTILAIGLVIGLAGCASNASLTDEGEVRFPDLDSTYLKTGDFVDPDDVLRISEGQHKDQVRLLLGHPHFSEGIFGVREWDYAFNFYTGNGNEYITCQYKLLFDRDMRVKSTYWRDAQCPALLVPIQVEEFAIEPRQEKLMLPGDVLFDFDSAQLTLEGRRALERIVAAFDETKPPTNVRVVGYADRFGDEQHNLRLSQARAETVGNYLASQGVARASLEVVGRGQADPVVNCPGSIATPSVRECLKPNRRVEITLQYES